MTSHPSLSRSGAIVAVAVALAVCNAAQVQSAEAAVNCAEIIPAQAGIQPAILLDKCNGRTWQLVPTYRGYGRRAVSYVWRPLVREEAKAVPAVVMAPPVSTPPPPPPRASAKCFQFNGRTFCE
jgi:hypothetical protein